MIQRILHRTVAAETSDEVEQFWKAAQALHPTWEHMTHRDPLDPAHWPLTADWWQTCTSGAQKAGLIRLEALIRFGGVYIDSDFECYQPFDPLLPLHVFAGWEDDSTVPDFVIGAERDHPVLHELLDAALVYLPEGAWASGPGVYTKLLPGREDVLLMPPQAFAPYHYNEKQRRHENHRHPYTFGAHHWAASWL